MRAGSLNKRVFIQKRVVTRDAYGAALETWNDWQQRWVSIEPVSGGETLVANATEGRVTHLVTLRYTDDLEPKMRFRYGTRILAMVAPLNIGERGKEITASCTEVL